jgi:hypothetical protein
MREPSAGAVAEGSVCVTELAKGAEVIRGFVLAAMATRAQDFVGRADVCLSAGRDRSQSMQVPRIAPDRPMRSLMLPAATSASRRACIPYEGPNVGKGSSPCENPPRHRQHVIFDLMCC